MSGFFKGIFGGKDENEELLAGHTHSVLDKGEEVEQLTADVRGTIDQEIDERLADHEPEHEARVEVQPQTSLSQESKPMTLATKDFSADRIWMDSGVSELERTTVHKAQALLNSLPASTPHPVKRQIVEASLQAFDVSIGEIVTGASHEINALREYIDETNDTTQRFTEVSDARIEALEAEIESIRETMRSAEDERDRLVGSASDVIADVQPVLDFFSPGKASLGGNLPSPATPVVAAADTNESN